MDKIAEVIETMMNITCSLEMPIPTDIQLEALRELLPKILQDLKVAYIEMGGEDHWS